MLGEVYVGPTYVGVCIDDSRNYEVGHEASTNDSGRSGAPTVLQLGG